MYVRFILALSLFCIVPSTVLHAADNAKPLLGEQLTVDLQLPALDVNPYHRPYVAVWIETPQRKGVATLAVWHERSDWLKDMRQWWRKLGRANQVAIEQQAPYFDAISGPTRKPGHYQLVWQGLDNAGHAVPAGDYWLMIEASREEGGRDFKRQKIQWGQHRPQVYTLQGDVELGEIRLSIKPQSSMNH